MWNKCKTRAHTDMCVHPHRREREKEQDNPWWVKRLWLVHTFILQWIKDCCQSTTQHCTSLVAPCPSPMDHLLMMLILQALSPCSPHFRSRTSARVSGSKRGCSKHQADQVWSLSSLTAIFWQKVISLKKKSQKPFLTSPAHDCLIFFTFWAEISNSALSPIEMLQRLFKEKWYFQYDNKMKCVSTYFPNSCKKL